MTQQPNDQHSQLRAQIAELQERDAEFARKANILLEIVAGQDRVVQFDERTNRFDRRLDELSESTRRTQATT